MAPGSAPSQVSHRDLLGTELFKPPLNPRALTQTGPHADHLQPIALRQIKAMSTGPRHLGSQQWKKQEACPDASHTYCTVGTAKPQRKDTLVQDHRPRSHTECRRFRVPAKGQSTDRGHREDGGGGGLSSTPTPPSASDVTLCKRPAGVPQPSQGSPTLPSGT